VVSEIAECRLPIVDCRLRVSKGFSSKPTVGQGQVLGSLAILKTLAAKRNVREQHKWAIDNRQLGNHLSVSFQNVRGNGS
jgi:hypothetical protein